jgi:hypothetical protein
MNKHILRLAKQSRLIQYESDGKMEEVEKFAELIVQECIDLISPYTIKGVEMIDPGTHLHPIYVIREHFEMPIIVERLKKENEELRNLLAVAYQMAGVVDAPEKYLDAFSSGKGDIDTLLPISFGEKNEG